MKRILVIDDDPLARDITRGLLEEAGYEVVDAADGATGVRLFREQAFDLVILDIFMPGLDGFETMQEMEPRSKGVPLLVLSGRGLSTGAFPLHLARTLGADETLSKSFAHEELLEKVRALTGERPEPDPGPTPGAAP